ncbi:MAG: lipoyl(octanoyl) transferase LipB, partial [Deltaproteobacteria bacterium]|nr:lipoyl(octanoyl) transferase LipB [Deltaproteobacteria bacterium]
VDFVEKLEAVMVQVLKEYGIAGERNSRNRGVWVGNRKIGFVGIAVRRGVSFHGLALNVSPDLSFFQLIHPCGLQEVKITSMADLLEEPVPLNIIKNRLVFHFEKTFEITLKQIKRHDLLAKLPGKNHDNGYKRTGADEAPLAEEKALLGPAL